MFKNLKLAVRLSIGIMVDAMSEVMAAVSVLRGGSEDGAVVAV